MLNIHFIVAKSFFRISAAANLFLLTLVTIITTQLAVFKQENIIYSSYLKQIQTHRYVDTAKTNQINSYIESHPHTSKMMNVTINVMFVK